MDYEPLVRTLLADELRAAGVIVVEAASATEAWSLLSKGEPVDVVFSDLRTPGAIDGVELATRIRDHYPSIAIILTSGSHPAVDLSRFGRFLQKPYSISVAIQAVMESYRPG